ncbi:MAG: GNAT family N-acetyltransferase [Clostridia bacterium]
MKTDVEYINSFHSDMVDKDKNNSITKYITSKGILLGDVFKELCLNEDSCTDARIVLDDHDFVGAVMYNVDIVGNKKVLNLEAIIVHPQLTGKGIGRKILHDVISYSADIFGIEIHTIQAIVEKDNMPSQKIFDINKFSKKDRNKDNSDKYISYSLDIE